MRSRAWRTDPQPPSRRCAGGLAAFARGVRRSHARCDERGERLLREPHKGVGDVGELLDARAEFPNSGIGLVKSRAEIRGGCMGVVRGDERQLAPQESTSTIERWA